MTVVAEGAVYAIAGSVDTDVIIRSRRCTTADPAALAPYCLEELPQSPPFVPGAYAAIVCDGVFGVGSARIQAPAALAGAGVRAVIALDFAPIFLENCLNGAYLLPLRAPVPVLPASGAPCRVAIAGRQLHLTLDGATTTHPVSLPDWALAGRTWMSIIEEQARDAGGLAALRVRGMTI